MPSVNVKRLLLKILGGVVLLAFFYVALVPLSAEFERAGEFLARHGGVAGVFLYVYVVDAIIVPAALDVVFPFIMRWPPLPVLTAMCTASVLGGITGYGIGRFLNRFPFIRRRTETYRERGEHLIRRYGIWAVVVAALLPLPFSTVSWIAGALQLRFLRYTAGALCRVPRIVATYFMLQTGISLFS